MRSQFGSIPSLIHELTSLVLLVSFMARWDAAHGQHYGSTFWKSGVGWNKEVPRQRVCRRGNHQQWAWVIINSEWLVGKLFSFAVIMHEGWVRPPSRETIWARPPSSEIVPSVCSLSLSFFNLGLVEVQEVHAGFWFLDKAALLVALLVTFGFW